MGAAVAHDLSPELVLVSPDLRERALRTLPARDPDALFAVAPAPAPPIPPEHASLPAALAAYVAEALLFGALRGAAMIAVIALAAFLLAR